MAAGLPARLTATEGRRFGLAVGGAFLALGALVRWRGGGGTVPLALGALLVAGGLLAPRALAPVHRAWMGLALVLSKVTTPITMGAIYFLVITPIGVVMRLLGRNPMVHRPVQDSYWVERTPRPDPADTMRHQF